MAEKLEDLNLPNASVQKIIKEALPDHVIVGKDAKSALSRAASVFVLYITSQASTEAQKANRKTLVGQDIITALEELEFENFIEPLQNVLKDTNIAKLYDYSVDHKLNICRLHKTRDLTTVMYLLNVAIFPKLRRILLEFKNSKVKKDKTSKPKKLNEENGTVEEGEDDEVDETVEDV